jgi:antitoxin ParD1/3/4
MENTKKIKRLNATLPDKLAKFVGEITGDGGLYETPSEFVRDLIRRYMENVQQFEAQEINTLLLQSISENDYSAWDEEDLQDIRNSIQG